ncbi:MAG: hypothetical protein FWD58_06415 [Firmicutes bacterium]|nr:hypothetical protein [Bacillota bacterium]
MPRVNKLFINSVFGVIAFFISTLATLFVQRIFLSVLGAELVGLNAVLNTVISTLSIVELGIGPAIVFSLYKPLAENNEQKVAQLIRLYRKIFFILGTVVVVLGFAVMPFLPALTKGVFDFWTIFPLFLLFLGNSYVGYLLTFNHTLLSADQKQFVLSIVTSCARVVVAGAQIALLLTTRQYYPLLIANLVISAAFNLLLMLYVQKKYPYLSRYRTKLSPEELKPIKDNVAALVYHRIGNFMVVGLIPIIVSVFLGVDTAGYYSFYLVLSTALVTLIAGVFSGITATFGNLVACESREAVYQGFIKARFLNFCLFAIAAVGMYVLTDDILRVWLNDENVILPATFLIMFTVNFFVTGYSSMLGSIRAAAGVFKPDRYLHILLAVAGIGLSLIFVQFWGITGALVGITVSLVIKEVIVLPIIGKYYIYGGRLRNYYLRMLADTAVMAGCAAVAWAAYYFIPIQNSVVKLILGFVICIAVPTLILTAVYFWTREFKYLIDLIKRILSKLFKKSDKDNGKENGV